MSDFVTTIVLLGLTGFVAVTGIGDIAADLDAAGNNAACKVASFNFDDTADNCDTVYGG